MKLQKKNRDGTSPLASQKGDESTTGTAAASSDEAPADEQDDTHVELVKDWNIPSWNDLIASLYRPDR